MPDNVVRTLLRKATEGLVQAQQAAQAGEAQQAALELQLANKTSEAETAKAVRHGGVCELFRSWHCLVADTTPQALRRAKLDFDRRLTTRQQRFEAKTARLMRQLRHGPRTDASMALSAGGEGEDGSAALTVPVEHVAKENAYYKHANRYVVALFRLPSRTRVLTQVRAIGPCTPTGNSASTYAQPWLQTTTSRRKRSRVAQLHANCTKTTPNYATNCTTSR